ncbi:hypothetical protein GCM10023336_59240 [Streptomyces similanensis]|uniref:Uncharacterized protein n=1 Tax=Streptomyces similanensis TaxID=1274988 RepID=A0ABP9LAV0_9ACTN
MNTTPQVIDFDRGTQSCQARRPAALLQDRGRYTGGRSPPGRGNRVDSLAVRHRPAPPRLIARRTCGPLCPTDRKAPTGTPTPDVCPESGRARLSYRRAAARDLHPDAEKPGGTPERTLLTGLDLTDPDETAFTTEYFSPVLGVAEFPGTATQFLDTAVTAANERLHGTLGANLIAHPDTIKALVHHLRAAVADLRHGTIAINAWTGVGYATPPAPLGAPTPATPSTTSRAAWASFTTPFSWTTPNAPSSPAPSVPHPAHS